MAFNNLLSVLLVIVLIAVQAHASKKCVKPQKKCSMYTDTCCKDKVCSASMKFYKTGVTTCVKPMKFDAHNITYGPDSLPGWEAGHKDSPAVLMLQEWWGINEAIKQQAEHVAQQGFRVLIPDLYRGKVALTSMEAGELRNELDFPRAIADFKHAVDYLKETGSDKVVAVGYCMGGGLALCAGLDSGVVAASSYYGLPTAANCNVSDITVPVQNHIGTLDTRLIGAAPAVVAQMDAAGVENEYYMYEGMPHAFMNLMTPAGRSDMLETGNLMPGDLPSEKQAVLGFQRLIKFLRLHLEC
eukprot:gene14343-20336_t